jgi:hypothetical protein
VLRLKRVRQAEAHHVAIRARPHLVLGTSGRTAPSCDGERVIFCRAVGSGRTAESVAPSFGDPHNDVWLSYVTHQATF